MSPAARIPFCGSPPNRRSSLTTLPCVLVLPQVGKDPAPTQEVQNEAAYTNFMGGDDFAGGSASLHDLALILGEGNYVFQELPAQVEPEPEPAVEPVSEEEGRCVASCRRASASDVLSR